MKKTYQENKEAKELKRLIRKYLDLVDNYTPASWCHSWNLEREIYLILKEMDKKKRLCKFGSKKTTSAWIIIDGIDITEKESEVIELVIKKGLQNNGYKI